MKRKALLSVPDVTDTCEGEEFCSRLHQCPGGRQSDRTVVLTSADGLDGGILLQRNGDMKAFFVVVEVICYFQCPTWL